MFHPKITPQIGGRNLFDVERKETKEIFGNDQSRGGESNLRPLGLLEHYLSATEAPPIGKRTKKCVCMEIISHFVNIIRTKLQNLAGSFC